MPGNSQSDAYFLEDRVVQSTLFIKHFLMQQTIQLSATDIQNFERDGFVIVNNVLSPAQIESARSRFEKLFSGDFETGIQPDEWNWKNGDDPALTRQICNAWKSDRTIASIVLRTDIGKACARLRDLLDNTRRHTR